MRRQIAQTNAGTFIKFEKAHHGTGQKQNIHTKSFNAAKRQAIGPSGCNARWMTFIEKEI